MNVALVFDGDLEGGGGYQQQLASVLDIYKIENYNFIVFVFTKENKIILDSYGIRSVFVEKKIADKIFRFLIRQDWFSYLSAILKKVSLFEKRLGENKIDLVYFLSPSGLSMDLLCHNYIITVWDLCHRDFMEFPEVKDHKVFEQREQLYTKSLKKAVAVIADSDLGKQNIINRYGVDEKRVFAQSFLPAPGTIISEDDYQAGYIDIKKKYSIKGEYLFYPAQFWTHKNHIYILNGLLELKQVHGISLTAVFTGLDMGNLGYIKQMAVDLGIEHRVVFTGFVANEEMPYLYRQSLALVMPTYFGPTNLPPLEAFTLGVPVLYSDLEGLRDQVGDAALLMDLSDSASMAKHLYDLLTVEGLRDDLVSKGKSRLDSFSSNKNEVLINILENYRYKRICW